ncbi:carboxypeptidase B-like [Achroia grisella]|uniref:carboxypeptidase B-like n=1 Tax=Achroia grisella TaxID=688607 RepID=UPI0027D29120|nr:carboxypeptidase B-like [Achroia grisella]
MQTYIIAIILWCSGVYAKNEIYDGHILYEITVQNVEQTRLVTELEELLHVSVFTHAVPGRSGQVLVSKERRGHFETKLSAEGIEYKVIVENIKDVIDLEERLLTEATSRSNNRTRNGGVTFDRIYTYEEIDAYLEELQTLYPETVTLVNAGNSVEGRAIKYIRVSTTNFQDSSKPVVFIESLLHAREWITLPATLYAIHRLVIDVTEEDLLQDIDWIILPIVNPDGYVFTHVENRFWRKNRAPSTLCPGVDLNRNFDINWGEASSNIACMETFHGPEPFSEPETSIVRDIKLAHSNRLELFLDIHSFGSMILYGYGNGTLPSNGLILHLVGVEMATAINAVKASFNPDYIVGNVALVLYQASGSAQDYAQAIGSLSYTYELPGYRFGIGGLGFLVDPDFIEQAGMETWEGIKVGARYARDNYRHKHKSGLTFSAMIISHVIIISHDEFKPDKFTWNLSECFT